MIKENVNLVSDCDNVRKTPLHHACYMESVNLAQIFIDFGAPMFAKDDFAKRPLDELIVAAQTKAS